MICADPALSALDEQMAQLFREAQDRAGGGELRQAQRRWLTERDRCADTACLGERYRERIAALRQPPPACRAAVGVRQAALWVRQCIQVSPATHPPCNDANPCGLITDEIARGCGMLGADKPGFCPL